MIDEKSKVLENMLQLKIKSSIGLKFGYDDKEFDAHCFNCSFMRILAMITGSGGNTYEYNQFRPIQVWDFNDPQRTLVDGNYNLTIKNGQYGLRIATSDKKTHLYAGIVLGTGNTPTNWLTTSDMDGVITSGTGAGQLVYSEGVKTNGIDESDPLKMSYRITRTVVNNSGADVIVKELGLSTAHGDNGLFDWGSIGERYLLARDILEQPITIANGETKTFFFAITFEKGSGWTLTKQFLTGLRYAMYHDYPSYTTLDDYFQPQSIWCSNDNAEMERAPDDDVASKIPHGVNDDQLFYFNMSHNPSLMYEEQATKSIIKFNQAVWNYGSTTLTVYKVYLRALNHMMAGKYLSTPLVIPANSGAMIQYQIEVGV